ncbi:UDP-glucosyltransferase 2 [Spodoptera frugiperda]|uniref:UDP-glucosyltransferase 2 n=1 Tax=Spodoptera frugiperda TaxID=7108 RepID=A0A9R0DZM7_SPOFR|nr:UDP-glucosyltransferase 2 [Spodoptera frugiperda]
MADLKSVLFGVLLMFCSCEAYKILAIFPVPSTSHGILGDNMIKHLLNAGHEVTYITPFIKTKKYNHPNLKIVDVSANEEYFDESLTDIKMIMSGALDYKDPVLMAQLTIMLATTTLGNPNVHSFLKDPNQQFDVIIGEYMFSDMYSVFQAVFQCPFIWFSTIQPHWGILKMVHAPLNPSYNSDYIIGNVAPFTFKERVQELWYQLKGLFYHKYINPEQEDKVYQEHVVPILRAQGKPVPNYEELKYNASLVLGNSQVVFGNAVPLPPNYQHIGGFHIDEDVKPLPEDLKKLMDNAKNGVIYFSLGSNIRSKDLPDSMKEGLLEIFGKLKQTVIWKFEENLDKTPKNVHIVQWAPQQSLLGKLKCNDNYINGLYIYRYTAKIKEISVAYHHSPMKPGEALNFWVEHVVRTRGAPHLRSVALQVPLYQQAYLDLLAVILAAVAVILLVVKRILSLFTSESPKLKRN